MAAARKHVTSELAQKDTPNSTLDTPEVKSGKVASTSTIHNMMTANPPTQPSEKRGNVIAPTPFNLFNTHRNVQIVTVNWDDKHQNTPAANDPVLDFDLFEKDFKHNKGK